MKKILFFAILLIATAFFSCNQTEKTEKKLDYAQSKDCAKNVAEFIEEYGNDTTQNMLKNAGINDTLYTKMARIELDGSVYGMFNIFYQKSGHLEIICKEAKYVKINEAKIAFTNIDINTNKWKKFPLKKGYFIQQLFHFKNQNNASKIEIIPCVEYKKDQEFVIILPAF